MRGLCPNREQAGAAPIIVTGKWQVTPGVGCEVCSEGRFECPRENAWVFLK
jgi:hypothetical protein